MFTKYASEIFNWNKLRNTQTQWCVTAHEILRSFSILRKGVTPEVQLRATPQTNSLQITIVDNGVGIPADSRDKVWDMFYVANEKSSGNGLGLYIVRKCVQALNGYISMESEEDSYTRIVIVIPAKIERHQVTLPSNLALSS